MSNCSYAFLLTSPAVALYLVAYFFIIKAPNKDQKELQAADTSADSVTEGTTEGYIQKDETKPLLHENSASAEEKMFQGKQILTITTKNIMEQYDIYQTIRNY